MWGFLVDLGGRLHEVLHLKRLLIDLCRHHHQMFLRCLVTTLSKIVHTWRVVGEVIRHRRVLIIGTLDTALSVLRTLGACCLDFLSVQHSLRFSLLLLKRHVGIVWLLPKLRHFIVIVILHSLHLLLVLLGLLKFSLTLKTTRGGDLVFLVSECRL